MKSKTKNIVLSNADQYYIENNPKGLTLSEMAEELGKDVEVIEPFYKAKAQGEDCVHYRGYTAMTESLSAFIDQHRKPSHPFDSSKYKNSIHRPKGNK